MHRKLLLVEDDARMREIISDYFKNDQWTVLEAEDGWQALELFEQTAVDLILLDIMIPELDGWAVCRRVREQSDVPIIIITAKSEDDDQLMGYGLGADAYVTKPFSPRVLVARATSLMKRKEGTVGIEGDDLVYGELLINRGGHKVFVAGELVNLSPKEYDLLLYLIKHYGKVVSRDQTLDSVWGYDYLGDLRTVDTHIKKLRAKLGGEGRHIHTVIRSGYKFELAP